jgi:hypothetical protein
MGGSGSTPARAVARAAPDGTPEVAWHTLVPEDVYK